MVDKEQRFLDSEVTQDEYDIAGSKFITVAGELVVGHKEYREVEITDWDIETPGKSHKVEVTVTEEGPDNGKTEKISYGITADGIWKGKNIHRAVTGEDMPINPATERPAVNPLAVIGKPATGMWEVIRGQNQKTGGTVIYPKLQDIFPAGYKPGGDDER